jgi:hypothetical protein
MSECWNCGADLEAHPPDEYMGEKWCSRCDCFGPHWGESDEQLETAPWKFGGTTP